MFSVITAIAIAAGSEAVDGIRGRGASCSGGSCSVAQPVEKPESVKVAKATEEASAVCGSTSCGSQRRGGFLRGLRSGCR